MFKGLIKNLFGITLGMAPLAGFLAGVEAIVLNHPKNGMENKIILLNKYTATAEYKEIVEELSSKNSEMNFVIDKIETKEELYQVESIAVSYGGIEINEKLSELNKEIAEMEKNCNVARVVTAASFALTLPLTFCGMKFMTYGDSKHELVVSEDGEDYLNKEIII